ncbi:MAG: tRNA (adenosine(37)-N6)-threonylcarbamoyltransferase complex dimerization subunit type 1 TsaB [Dehalococcoidales bacterium]|nr:tRNA (adenosine(37)-N6)-threonylcarbamoyltransferase complex dimerization subunit type 1 TsaB [Dehalococcoidales bacterium]
MHLAIDTSTDTAGIALADEFKLLAELTWSCGQNHSVELMPRMTQLLEQGRIKFEDIKGIVVATGPGSFNGLRVGVSTAKALSFSLKIPLVGISTLEMTAYGHSSTMLPICPVINAGRSEVAAALFRQTNAGWQKIKAEQITTIERLCIETSTATVFCGELTQAAIDELTAQLGAGAIIPSPSARMRRCGFLAELGYIKLKAGICDNPAALQPIYLKKPPITQHKNMAPLTDEEM